jgi:hypothetical protein
LIGLLFAVSAPLNAFAAAEAQYSEQELRAYAFANAGVRLIQGGLDRRLIEATRRRHNNCRKRRKNR